MSWAVAIPAAFAIAIAPGFVIDWVTKRRIPRRVQRLLAEQAER